MGLIVLKQIKFIYSKAFYQTNTRNERGLFPISLFQIPLPSSDVIKSANKLIAIAIFVLVKKQNWYSSQR